MKEKLTSILCSIGIMPDILGFNYAREAILFIISCGDRKPKLAAEVYVHIANKFGSTPSRVERLIRHAIECAWKSKKAFALEKLLRFKLPSVQMTNGEFLFTLAEYIKDNGEEIYGS